MRKFFSLIAAVLFAGSMMATTVSKTVEALASEKSWENAAVVTPFNLDDVISVATEATDANTGKYYTNGQQIRLYQTGAAQLVISAAEGHAINSITLTYASQNTGILVEAESGVPVTFDNVQSATFTVGNSGGATNGQARITAFEVVYDEEGGVTPPPADTYTVAGAPESIFGSYWDPTDTSNDMVLGDDGRYYWERKVYLTAGTTVEFKVVKNHSWNVASYPESNVTSTVEEDGEYMFPIAFQLENLQVFSSLEKVEEPAGPTNCAEAAEAALSVSANNELYNDGAVYTIEGYVTAIQTAFNPTYNNITFWMADTQDGGQVLEAYRAACESEEDAPNVGDKVAVTGSLTKYNNTPEFAAACTYVILERAEVVEPQNLGEKTIAEFLALKNITDTCILTGVVDSIMNTVYGNLYMSDATAQLYIYGLLTPEGEARHFEDLNVEVGDTLTVKAIYNEYQGNPQAKNAIFVEVRKASAPVVEGPSNCAEAAAAALSVSANNELYNNGAVYTIEGYVTAIKTAYSDQYHNISFWMADSVDGGEVLQAYRAVCDSAENAPNVGDKVAVTGSLTKYNNIPEFAAACTFVIIERAAPVAGDTIVIDIESNVDYVDRVAAQGWWQFMVETDEYEISLSNISTTQAAGVYTMDEMDDDYTYINVKATGTEVTFVDGSLTLTEGEDGSRTIEGVVTGSDGNIYVIKLVYHIPTAETTVNVEIPEWGIVDGSDYYGVTSYIFYGEAADGTYVQITILGSNPIGQFTYEDCYAGGTGIQVDGDYKSIYSMDINVSVSDAQRAIITADILCVNNTLYHVTTPYGTGFDSVEAAVKAVKKLIDGNVVIEKAGIRYSINGQVIR